MYIKMESLCSILKLTHDKYTIFQLEKTHHQQKQKQATETPF